MAGDYKWTLSIRHLELVERDIENAELGVQFRRYLILGRRRFRILKVVLQASAISTFSALPPDVVAALRQLSQDLTQRITTLRETSQSYERQQLLAELFELEDRLWLSTILEDVRAEIDRKQQIVTLDTASIVFLAFYYR